MQAEPQLLYERSQGYQLYLVSFSRDSEKQYAFVVADSVLDAYDAFKADRETEPEKIQLIDLAGMGFFLLKKREHWSDH